MGQARVVDWGWEGDQAGTVPSHPNVNRDNPRRKGEIPQARWWTPYGINATSLGMGEEERGYLSSK